MSIMCIARVCASREYKTRKTRSPDDHAELDGRREDAADDGAAGLPARNEAADAKAAAER